MDAIDELLLQVLDRPEEQWEAGVEELCAGRPHEAVEFRRRFGVLRLAGFVGGEPAPAPVPVVPQHLGEYELLERLGQGGMGVVFAARQPRLERMVALKLVRPEHLYFPGTRERFQREIAAVAKLSHPGIVSVFAVGDEQGVPFLAMELLRGASLEEVLRVLAGRQVESLTGADLAAVVAARASVAAESLHDELFAAPWPVVCMRIVRRVAEALAHAHQNGVIHRDVKPSNVIVTPEGRVVLLDFGLAMPTGADRMTRDGSQVGSLPYMAPEQLRGSEGDARTDVYGLGVLLRELLTLQQPFLSPTSETTRQRILHGDGMPVAPGNRAVSWELATVCAMATELEPRRRYGAAIDLARDLENVLSRRPIAARPAGLLRRAWRAAQRQPALTTGLLVFAFAAVGTPSAIAVSIAAQRDRARAAEDEQQRKAYQANLAGAAAALVAHDAAEVRQRLDACPDNRRGFEWRHLATALDGSLMTLRGHQDRVTAVAITKDAKFLASGGADGEVRLWDVASGAAWHCFSHHHAGILQLAFTGNGGRLLATDGDGYTSVVDVAACTLLADRRRSSPQYGVEFGDDAKTVLVNQGGWRLLELDPETLLLRREILLEQSGKAPSALLCSDGRWLAAMGGNDLHRWDLETGRHLPVVPSAALSVAGTIGISADGRRFAIAARTGRSAIVSAADGQVVQVFGDRGMLSAVALDHRGELVVAGGIDGAIRAWAVDSGQLLSMQPGHVGPINSIALANARCLVATAGDDRTVRLWSPFGSRDDQVLSGHVGVISRMAVTPDGARLLSVSHDGSMRIWDLQTGLPLVTRCDYSHHVNALAVTADGRVALSTFHDSIVRTDLEAMTAQTWLTRGGWILDLAVAPDGKTALVAGVAGCALVDTAERRILHQAPVSASKTMACAFGDGGRVAYFGDGDGRLVRWDLAGDHTTLLAHLTLPIRAIAVARSGRSLVVAAGIVGNALGAESAASGMVAATGAVSRHRAVDGAIEWQRSCSSAPLAITELVDGSRIVTGHRDGSVVFWDPASGEPLLVRRLGNAAITSLACDPAGGFVAVGTASGVCHLLRSALPNPADVLRTAGTQAAMHLHAQLRNALRTRDGVSARIDDRTDLDPSLQEWMRACEGCWMLMPWHILAMAYDVANEPGLHFSRYATARQIAEVLVPPTPESTAMIVLTSARLGDAARALAASDALTPAQLAAMEANESMIRAGRALALQATGQTAAAKQELSRLGELAAAPDAPPFVVSLWREVETALAK